MADNARAGLDPAEPRLDDTLYTWDQTGPHTGQVFEITDALVVAQDAPVLGNGGEHDIVLPAAPEEPALDEPAFDLDF